jgi:ADP-ribose pyrophosphatase
MTTPVWLPTWSYHDVEIKENNLVYEGFFKVQQLQLRHQCFSGQWSPWLVREQVHHSDAAAVLLIDLENQKLVMVEQCRIGMISSDANVSPWVLEIVAGLIESGESPESTVTREALEEADCTIEQLHKIGEFYNSPGGFREKTTLYCGRVSSLGKEGIRGVGTEHEDIRVHVLDMNEVLQAFEQGAFHLSSSTYIALQWLILNLRNGHPFLMK